jgi:hypothetical protein
MHSNGAHTFATRQGAKVTEYRGHGVIIPRRSGWLAQVQGFPDQLSGAPILYAKRDASNPHRAEPCISIVVRGGAFRLGILTVLIWRFEILQARDRKSPGVVRHVPDCGSR